MILKTWRPFWSYDVEKTEQWLSEMATEGKQLAGMNRMTRMFLFDDGKREAAEYQIVYDKSKSELPGVLKASGWDSALTEGNWQFMKNGEDVIRAYPVRDNLLRRNRLHSIVLMCISGFYGFQLMMPLLFLVLPLIFLGPGEVNIVPSPLWSLTILYFLQVVGVIVLTIQMTRKLRAFERKYFSTGVDEKRPVGKTFSKWKFGWVYAPDLVEEWLSDMAAEGNHLVRVGKQNARFIFEKGAPKRVSYVYDYQMRTSPSYYDTHKSAGWQLKFTSAYSFTKYSIWQKEYEVGEAKPRFTYDAHEKKGQVRKVILASAGTITYSILMLAFVLWLYQSSSQEFVWSPFMQLLLVLVIVSVFVPIRLAILTIGYFIRMRRA